MSHLPFALSAYFFNALSVLANKFLLNKSIPDPLLYVFYISLISFAALLAAPFTNMPSPDVLVLASLSTIFWTMGAYFMFGALKTGQVSKVIPLIGTIVPLVLLFFAAGTGAITKMQVFSAAILISGMVFLTLGNLKEALNVNEKEMLYMFGAGVFFAFSYLLLREAFNLLDFFSVLIWSRPVLLPFALLMLTLPSLRRRIFTEGKPKLNFFSKTGALFIGGQASGLIAELLLVFSISLSIPALVNSLQGTQYVYLLIFSLILSKKYPAVFGEKYTLSILLPKAVGILLIGAGLYLLAIKKW